MSHLLDKVRKITYYANDKAGNELEFELGQDERMLMVGVKDQTLEFKVSFFTSFIEQMDSFFENCVKKT